MGFLSSAPQRTPASAVSTIHPSSYCLRDGLCASSRWEADTWISDADVTFLGIMAVAVFPVTAFRPLVPISRRMSCVGSCWNVNVRKVRIVAFWCSVASGSSALLFAHFGIHWRTRSERPMSSVLVVGWSVRTCCMISLVRRVYGPRCQLAFPSCDQKDRQKDSSGWI